MSGGDPTLTAPFLPPPFRHVSDYELNNLILCYQDKVRLSFHEKILCSKSGETRLEKQSGGSAAAGRAPAARWPPTTSDGCRTTGGDAGGTLQP